MKLARALLLALALLNAQHTALAHQIWHLLGNDSIPAQEALCCQHDALGTVAGAMDTPTPLASVETPAVSSYVCIILPAASSPGLAPSSRGPPTLL